MTLLAIWIPCRKHGLPTALDSHWPVRCITVTSVGILQSIFHNCRQGGHCFDLLGLTMSTFGPICFLIVSFIYRLVGARAIYTVCNKSAISHFSYCTICQIFTAVLKQTMTLTTNVNFPATVYVYNSHKTIVGGQFGHKTTLSVMATLIKRYLSFSTLGEQLWKLVEQIHTFTSIMEFQRLKPQHDAGEHGHLCICLIIA